MLAVARKRYAEVSRLEFVQGDALALPIDDESFDAATIAFGMRNLADYHQGFAELRRAVRPGGRVVCLEIARPSSRVARAAQAWFDRIVPIIGRVAGQGSAYGYLVASTQAYPEPERIAGIMREVGLEDVRWEPLTLGIVTLHVGRRRG
jgi:demethylmenaquinone methyltransferase / 2-methoxy-6-polyprenyl-1,4-benzoquinol methylase